MATVYTQQIKEQFEREMNIPQAAIREIADAFPYSRIIHVHTVTRSFRGLLTSGGRPLAGSFEEEQ